MAELTGLGGQVLPVVRVVRDFQRHTLSEDWLRTMDGKGSGGPSGFSARRPGRDGRSVNTGAKGVLVPYSLRVFSLQTDVLRTLIIRA